jgi:hypothetical protein
MGKKRLLFCLIITVFFGCKKEQSEVKYFPIPDALMKIALFQKNSYWVYRNDTTGVIDCTYIKSDPVSGNITYKVNDHLDYVTDYFQMPLQSGLFYHFYLSGKLGDFPVSPGYPFLASIKGFSNACSPGKTAFVLHDDSLINHTGVNGYNCSLDPKYPYVEGDFFIELTEYSNFTLNDLLFDKVRETRSLFYKSSYSKQDTIDFYFSPGNGLIKIVFRVDTTTSFNPKRATMSWSLLRFKVVIQ